ncbi:laccase-like [Ciona intestinalis]
MRSYAAFLMVSALCLSMGSVTMQTCSPTSPCTPLKGGQAFREPRQVKGINSAPLTYTMTVGIADFTVDWLTVKRRLYDREFPGPTFTLKPGDKFNLNLINSLLRPDFTGPENTFRYPNTTNIHTHGLHISSASPQDNVLIEIGPGESFRYEYEIDARQPVGTYWYHPHYHGSVHFQGMGGMGGLIIIEDDPATMTTELASVSCPGNCEHDVQILLQTFQYSPEERSGHSFLQREMHDDKLFRLNSVNLTDSSNFTNLEQWLEDAANAIKYTLVNGLLNPVMDMEPGQMKRFRILDTGGLYAVALHIDNIDPNGPRCTVKEIAMDGVYLDRPRSPWLGRTFLVAAGRVDWLVICPEIGTYELRSSFFDNDEESMGEHPTSIGTFMTIRVTGVRRSSSLPTTLPQRQNFVSDLRQVTQENIKGRFVVEVTPTDTLNREDYSGVYYRYKMETNTIQEWHLTNTEMFTSHPIHMHINHAQVISYNPYTGPYGVDDGPSKWKLFSQTGEICTYQFKGYDATAIIYPPTNALKYLGHDIRQKRRGTNNTIGYVPIGDWRDTILVPPLGNITVRFNTHEYTGDVIIHCHLQGDADHGMAMFVQIVNRGENTEANITSGNANQSSCLGNFATIVTLNRILILSPMLATILSSYHG